MLHNLDRLARPTSRRPGRSTILHQRSSRRSPGGFFGRTDNVAAKAEQVVGRRDDIELQYIYDLMRLRLQRESACGNDLLLEVHNRSNEICLQLYEKELLTDTSYLHISGLQEHELNAKQLAVVSVAHDTVQELNRPTAFGALVGNSTSGRQSCIF